MGSLYTSTLEQSHQISHYMTHCIRLYPQIVYHILRYITPMYSNIEPCIQVEDIPCSSCLIGEIYTKPYIYVCMYVYIYIHKIYIYIISHLICIYCIYTYHMYIYHRRPACLNHPNLGRRCRVALAPEFRRSSEGMKMVTPPAGPRGTMLIFETMS